MKEILKALDDLKKLVNEAKENNDKLELDFERIIGDNFILPKSEWEKTISESSDSYGEVIYRKKVK